MRHHHLIRLGNPGNGHQYALTPAQTSFFGARAAAVTMGGTLVTIRNAAELLAQIEASLGEPQTPLIVETTGIGGEDVLLAWREPPLPQAINDKPKPPAADEHPSLATLAPRLRICPQEVNGIRVKVLELDSNEWEAAQGVLLQGMNRSSGGNFRVHMDTMGIDGMSGVKIDPVGEVGGYDESEIDLEEQ